MRSVSELHRYILDRRRQDKTDYIDGVDRIMTHIFRNQGLPHQPRIVNQGTLVVTYTKYSSSGNYYYWYQWA